MVVSRLVLVRLSWFLWIRCGSCGVREKCLIFMVIISVSR